MVTINNFSMRASNDATADTRQINVPCNFTPIVLIYRHLMFSWYSQSHLWSQLLTFNTDARLLVHRPYSIRVFLGAEVCCLVERHTVTRCDVSDRLFHPWWWSHFYQATRCQNKHLQSPSWEPQVSILHCLTMPTSLQRLQTGVSACNTPVHCIRPS